MSKKQRRAAKRYFPRQQREQPMWAMYFRSTTPEQATAIKSSRTK